MRTVRVKLRNRKGSTLLFSPMSREKREPHLPYIFAHKKGKDARFCQEQRQMINCPHRVDQTTGKTSQENAVPCPYLLQKFQAKQEGCNVLCTMSFYLFTQLFSREFETPVCLVIDEAHRIADMIRRSLFYEISDWHLSQSIKLLERIGAEEAKLPRRFLQAIKRIAKARKRLAGREAA